MKKICFLDYDMSIKGGVEKVTAELANAFILYGYEVHVISLIKNEDSAFYLDSRVKYSSILDSEMRLRHMRRDLKEPLAHYVKENGIDVVFLQGNYQGFIGSTLRFTTKAKLIFCDHGALMNQWNQKDIVAIRLISSLLSHKTVTLTEESMCDYIKKFHLSKKKVAFIYNWIEIESRNVAYNAESKKIISAGRLEKEKGYDLLIKAVIPALKNHKDWSVDIYGDGSLLDEYIQIIEELDLDGSVNFKGQVDNLDVLYKDYAFYVMSSYREGLPLTLLEAKANKLPIVSFDIKTGPREIVEDGINGLLVRPYKIEELSDAIKQLIESKELRIEMSKKSENGLYRFDKNTIMKKWIEIIETM